MINVSDITRSENLAKTHTFPLGSKVYIKYSGNEYWVDNESPTVVHAIKNKTPFFVVDLTRDCDGTPLYTLSLVDFPNNSYQDDFIDNQIFSDFFKTRQTDYGLSTHLAFVASDIKKMFICDCVSEDSISSSL